MSSDSPLFEVTTPAATAAARALTTIAKVKAALRDTGSTDDLLYQQYIDTISAECVGYCGLARAASAAVPTFGQEVVKATWLTTCNDRGTKLLLPWRAPITAIGQVVENGNNLTVNVDYRLLPGALLERMSGGTTPICWSPGKIIVPYTAGWVLPTEAPAELEGQFIEQVKWKFLTTTQSPALRSENVPDVYAASYAVAGGDSIGKSGLLLSLESVLSPFKNWAVA